MAGAGIQDCTLRPANPLFYVLLVCDERTKGNVLRNTQWLSLLVKGLPQDHLAGPGQIGMR
jgi:hypothetical protein